LSGPAACFWPDSTRPATAESSQVSETSAKSNCWSRRVSRPSKPSRVATHNGAQFLGELERIGTLAVGKAADVVVIRGNPAANIGDIRNVALVFKDGVGYDSTKLIESVKGLVGLR
jgi:predicted amidohydrolase YtcJ